MLIRRAVAQVSFVVALSVGLCPTMPFVTGAAPPAAPSCSRTEETCPDAPCRRCPVGPVAPETSCTACQVFLAAPHESRSLVVRTAIKVRDAGTAPAQAVRLAAQARRLEARSASPAIHLLDSAFRN